MSFSDSAVRLAGLAAALLGWPPATFWTATPAELAADRAHRHFDAARDLAFRDLAQLDRWLEQAVVAQHPEPTAMTLATAVSTCSPVNVRSMLWNCSESSIRFFSAPSFFASR